MQWSAFHPHVRHCSALDQKRIKDAFELGKRKHGDQKRKSGEPYFTHPIAVAEMLAALGADADTIIAALLHDTVEDTDLTLEEIDAQFNSDVATLIEGVTKLSAADVAEQPNLDQQIETVRKIFTLMTKDVRIMVIKLVDRLHNMQTVNHLSPAKQQNLARETMDVYVKIADRLCMQDMRDQLEELCLAVLEPDAHAQLASLREINRKTGERLAEKVRGTIDRSPHEPKLLDVHHEDKSWENLREQLRAEGSAITGVSNLNLVFVCQEIDTCYSTLGVLHQFWKREVTSFQDFINGPAINGYRGLHTTVILDDGTRVRCKIRTEEMQRYARDGVASFCFRPDTPNFVSLPWTERISPLSNDTRDRSDDFLASLQKDILGESMIVHGNENQAASLPRGSTVLDSVFYLYPNDAAHVSCIRMNGKETSPQTALLNAATITATFGKKLTAERQWLQWVQTGFATAKIREILSKRAPGERRELGKVLLQKFMTDRKRGFIEEFDPSILEKRAKSLGFPTMDELYIAIADGRVETDSVFRALFQSQRNALNATKRSCIVRYQVRMEDIELMDRLNIVHKQHGVDIEEIRYKRGKAGRVSSVFLHIHLSAVEQERLKNELEIAGATDVEIIVRTKREIALMACVILPWALNPVIAKLLMEHGMNPLPLITIRLLTFSVLSGLFFLFWLWISGKQYLSVPRLTLLASVPAIVNVGLSLFTYLALIFMPPSLHLAILRFNTFLLPANRARNSKQTMSALILCGFLLALCAAVFVVFLGEPYLVGTLLSVITLLCYTFYSLSTERTLQEHRIEVRQPLFLLHMGIVMGIIGLFMLFLQPLSSVWNGLTLATILYVFVCVFVPHTSYSALLRTTRFRSFTDLLLLEVPVAMLLESWILGITLSPVIYAFIGAILFFLLLLRWEKIHLPS